MTVNRVMLMHVIYIYCLLYSVSILLFTCEICPHPMGSGPCTTYLDATPIVVRCDIHKVRAVMTDVCLSG